MIPDFRLYGTVEAAVPSRYFNLVRIGQLVDKQPSARYVPHRHARLHELKWISAGHLSLTIDEATHWVGADTLCVIAAGSVHQSTVVPGLDGIMLHFTSDFLLAGPGEASSRLLSAFYGVPPLHLKSAATAARLRGLFERLESEFAVAGPEQAGLLRHYLHIILLEVQREASRDLAGRLSDISRPTASRFADLVEQHYLDRKQVSDYAELLHLTPNYLNVLVKRATGRTAGQLIRDRVILEAKRLLLFSEASVSEVAYALQLDDASYFWRLFKKTVLLSPTEFRRQEQP
jgi:AraC-like DNA-binding protein